MLFSAVSPGLAGALCNGRPEVLGRVLGISPAVPDAVARSTESAEDDGCPHESAGSSSHEQPSLAHRHGASGGESHDESHHSAHGTLCSFCLASGATVALLAAIPATPSSPESGAPAPGEHARTSTAGTLAAFCSRAPPSCS